MGDKLYIVTRNDLTKSQQAVQAGHALAEFLLLTKTVWSNGTLVYLKVGSEKELNTLTCNLNCSKIDYICFREPDMGNELTAIASLGTNEFFDTMRLL